MKSLLATLLLVVSLSAQADTSITLSPDECIQVATAVAQTIKGVQEDKPYVLDKDEHLTQNSKTITHLIVDSISTEDMKTAHPQMAFEYFYSACMNAKGRTGVSSL